MHKISSAVPTNTVTDAPASSLSPALFPLALLLVALLSACQSISPVADNPFSPAVPLSSKPLAKDNTIHRIAIGSCFDPEKADDIFGVINRAAPDVFLFIGDNVYAEDETDDPTLASLRASYALLGQSSQFAALRREVPVLATWDDHDYGKDDAGGDWPYRFFSEELFEYVWPLSARDIQISRHQQPGIYFSTILGAAPRRTQLIVLDTRFFRTLPQDPPDTHNMLGDTQWQWLEEQLNQPAEIRILVSSIQLLGTGYTESWSLMPGERQRLYDTINRSRAENVIVVSGDLHSGAFYKTDQALAYPLYELTASSLNVPLSGIVSEIKPKVLHERLLPRFHDENFGIINIDWETGVLQLQLHDKSGDVVREIQIEPERLRINTHD